MRNLKRQNTSDKYVIIKNGYLYIAVDQTAYETGRHQEAMRLEHVTFVLSEIVKNKKPVVYQIRIRNSERAVVLCYRTIETREMWYQELMRNHQRYKLSRSRERVNSETEESTGCNNNRQLVRQSRLNSTDSQLTGLVKEKCDLNSDTAISDTAQKLNQHVATPSKSRVLRTFSLKQQNNALTTENTNLPNNEKNENTNLRNGNRRRLRSQFRHTVCDNSILTTARNASQQEEQGENSTKDKELNTITSQFLRKTVSRSLSMVSRNFKRKRNELANQSSFSIKPSTFVNIETSL